MKILWLKRAEHDLESLFEFISQDNPPAAAREVELVIESVSKIGEFPAIGRPGRIADTRELPVGNYLIAYRVQGGNVQILRMLHASRQWPDRL